MNVRFQARKQCGIITDTGIKGKHLFLLLLEILAHSWAKVLGACLLYNCVSLKCVN